MNVTISGTRYSTNTAKLIGKGGWDDADKASPEWWQAGLFQRPAAKDFFIAGSGNSMTIFGGKDRIIPISPRMAKIWASWFLEDGTFDKVAGLTRR